jgi:hypothetical protein
MHRTETALKKSDLNQNALLWRFLDKKLTKFMKVKHSTTLKEPAYTTSLDQLTEFGIQDAVSIDERVAITHKKERKVFQNRPITLRMLMRNPLATDVSISKV